MNAGKNHTKARAQAQANADRSQSPRWLHQYGGAWWISTTPTADAERIDPTAQKSRHHATKKSSAQLEREIEAFLQSRTQAPNMPHAIPDRGYMVAKHGGGTYLSSFGSKDEAVRFARGLATQTREAYDIVKVQNHGEDRFIVDEIAPPSPSLSSTGRRSHSTKKTEVEPFAAARLADRLQSVRQTAAAASRLKSRGAKQHGRSADYWAKSAEQKANEKRYDEAQEDLDRAEMYIVQASRAAGLR